MSSKLKDRILSYQEVSDHKLMARAPLIIVINGRSFAKSTELLDKPYCDKFAECMFSTMLRICTELEGAIFGYQHNDEIVILARNDQTPETTPWYDNKIQKICSVTSGMATLHFNNCASTISLDFATEPVFSTQVFTVPTIPEAINTMVYKQQQNFYTSAHLACFYELLKKYDKHTIKEMLSGINLDEKIELLKQECNVDFNNDYPISFRRGAACYKVPKVTTDDVVKNKWFINQEPPIFTKDQSFLSNIFKNGADIFRRTSIE